MSVTSVGLDVRSVENPWASAGFSTYVPLGVHLVENSRGRSGFSTYVPLGVHFVENPHTSRRIFPRASRWARIAWKIREGRPGFSTRSPTGP